MVQRAVGGRERLRGLARREFHERGIARLHAGQAARRLLHERQSVLERLREHVERIDLPGRIGESAIAVAGRGHRLALGGLGVEFPQLDRLLSGRL